MMTIETSAIPDWLAELGANSPFPVKEVLAGSLYYPACGCDGDPVKYLGGLIHSFVYVDYSYTKEQIKDEIKRHGFRGYEALFCRELKESDLVPNGWTPMLPTDRSENPEMYLDRSIEPYALWLVLERKTELGEEHGPKRFSLLYIRGDGVASYQALYGGNSVSPTVVAIIQPGHGFGRNYTDFTQPDGFMAQTVEKFSTKQPPFLLYGGQGRGYDPCCWPQYSEKVKRWTTTHRQEILWRLK